MEKPMVKEYIFGLMDKFMMGSGKKDLNMDMVFGKELKGILMLVNGNFLRLMVTVFIFGLMGTDMKECGLMMLKKDQENLYIELKEEFMKENGV